MRIADDVGYVEGRKIVIEFGALMICLTCFQLDRRLVTLFQQLRWPLVGAGVIAEFALCVEIRSRHERGGERLLAMSQV